MNDRGSPVVLFEALTLIESDIRIRVRNAVCAGDYPMIRSLLQDIQSCADIRETLAATAEYSELY